MPRSAILACGGYSSCSRRVVLTALISWLRAERARADVYRWIDQSGQPHYSDQWVPGSTSSRPTRPHPATDTGPAPSQQKSLNDHKPGRRCAADQGGTARAVQQDVAKRRDALCKTSKDRTCARSPRGALQGDKDGERDLPLGRGRRRLPRELRKTVQDELRQACPEFDPKAPIPSRSRCPSRRSTRRTRLRSKCPHRARLGARPQCRRRRQSYSGARGRIRGRMRPLGVHDAYRLCRSRRHGHAHGAQPQAGGPARPASGTAAATRPEPRRGARGSAPGDAGRARGRRATRWCRASRRMPTCSRWRRALARRAAAGSLLLDCSTVGAETARRAAQLADKRRRRIPRLPGERRYRGRARCDARHHGRRRATQPSSARSRFSRAMGKTVTLFGPIGSGQAAKATNQIMCAGIIEAVARGHGVRPRAGAAAGEAHRHPRQGRGLQLVLRAPRTEHGARCVSRRASGCACTTRTCASATTWRHASASSCRWWSACSGEYAELVARGYGDEDISATYRLKSELFERTNLMGAPARGAHEDRGRACRPGPFYLPDFCTSRATLAIVLIVELTALVLTLARQSCWWTSGPTWCSPRCSCCGSVLPVRRLLCVLRTRLAAWTSAPGSAAVLGLITAVVVTACRCACTLIGRTPLVSTSAARRLFPRRAGALRGAQRLDRDSSSPVWRCATSTSAHDWRRSVELRAAARVHALQARIRPHFLFNSMNTIAALTRSDPRARGSSAVQDLADLFRAALSDKRDTITLAEELEVARTYQRIEQLRLGERLQGGMEDRRAARATRSCRGSCCSRCWRMPSTTASSRAPKAARVTITGEVSRQARDHRGAQPARSLARACARATAWRSPTSASA